MFGVSSQAAHLLLIFMLATQPRTGPTVERGASVSDATIDSHVSDAGRQHAVVPLTLTRHPALQPDSDGEL